MREHGGDLDRAVALYGGAAATWIDLSTGINPRPYPLPELPPDLWAKLPKNSQLEALEAAAAKAYGTAAICLTVAGAQAAIQMIPHLSPRGRARVVSPTYNEHAAALRNAGWRVDVCETLEGLSGADLAVVVNPNNPDGRRYPPAELLELRGSVGLLVVDESFADTEPASSLSPLLSRETDGIIVLRSFGKFFGLAGLRLGFVLAGGRLADRLRALVGPWPVSGPAIAVGRKAFEDARWQDASIARLREEAGRLDDLARMAGWALVGGTPLFRTYDTGDAARAKDRLARVRIWSRSFPYSDSWLRLGFPGPPAHWARLERALAA